MRFVVPPHWPPTPEGWVPPPGWQPPPEWGPAPEGWQFWQEDQRPSVWATLGIALLSAFVLGGTLGVLRSGGDDVAYSMGQGFGGFLLPALVIGGAWPWTVRRHVWWAIPLAVLLVGGLLHACTVAVQQSGNV